MKIKYLLILLSIVVVNVNGQIAPTKYFIQFTDKNNSPYSLSNPSDFLTQRAINRRLYQGIQIDSTDLPVNPSYIDTVLSMGQVALLNTSRWLNGITIQVNDSATLSAIYNLPFVSQVEYVAPRYSQKDIDNFYEKINFSQPEENFRGGKILHNDQKNNYNYGLSYNQVEMIGVDYLHNQGYNGDGKVIAVLDAGFYRVDSLVIFDSLRTAGNILGDKDFTSPGGNVYNAHWHGMMVLSLMGGHIPGQLVGTSPAAAFWLLQSEYAPTEFIIEEYNWVSAAEFADSVGADIINSSLGYSEFDDPSQNHTFADLDGQTTIVSQGANMAASKGIVVVNSAGNSALHPWQRIITPADAQGVLTIGSVNYDAVYSTFSSVGPSADGRVKPDVAAQGEDAVVATTDNSIMTGSGTSFSAPLVSGAIACLWQANPNATNWDIMEAIRQSAHQYHNPDSLLGYGIPNFALAHAILSGVSIDEQYTAPNINVFPNPFHNDIKISYYANETQSLHISMYDIHGRKVYEKYLPSLGVGNNSIIIESLSISVGLYILQIKTSDIIFQKKIVKTY